jgi:hypothetical protein
MIKLNDEKKVDVSLLEIQRPLSNELIKDYNHKEVMKEIHDIFLQLKDNFFYFNIELHKKIKYYLHFYSY